MENGKKINPLIVTQKPSKSSLHHQLSVELSDDDYEECMDPSPPSHPTTTVPETTKLLIRSSISQSAEHKVKEKKKRKSFLFRRKKKKSLRGSLELQDTGPSSDSGSSLREFADVLVDPSLIRKLPIKSTDRLLSLPGVSLGRSVSDSAVDRVGLYQDEERRRERYYEEEEYDDTENKRWLVQITLESGHGLAVRDRTGTSDPYVKLKCGPSKYRSTVVNRNLNPEWNEAFSFITDGLRQPLEVNVYDHDYGSLDDYMGGGTITLNGYTHGQLHIVDIGLRDPNAKESSLGFIRIFLNITEYIDEPGEPENAVPHSIQEWDSVLTIHLLKGYNLLAMDDNGFSDPYCKFKLGRQKRRSKVVTRSLNPNWKEQFDMRMYRGEDTTLHVEVWDRDLMQSDDFIGQTCIKLDTLTREQTHDLTLPLHGQYHGENYGTIHLLLTITGTKVHEVTDSTSTITYHQSHSIRDMRNLMERYFLSQSFSLKLWNDIGHAIVIIDRVEGLRKAVDVFAIVEVGNSQARTHTVYKTSTPFWGKAFHFDLKDIHTTLEVSVYCDKTKPELLGRVKIPLLQLEVGLNKAYVMKDKKCLEATQGVLYLKCDLVYQPVRAALCALKPRECKLMDKEVPFQRKVLMHNIKKIKTLVNELSIGMVWIRHIYNWENKLHSFLALMGFIVGCLVFELWMVPLLLMVGFLVQYRMVYRKSRPVQYGAQEGSSTEAWSRGEEIDNDNDSDWDDDLEDVSGQRGKGGGGRRGSGIRKKFRQIQGILLIVQNVLGEIADTGERVNNLLSWKVPFLCWLCIFLLLFITVVTIIVPLRYLILIWGINKLTKKLRNPHHIPHNELRDLISCSPTNHDLQEYREFTIRRISQTSSVLPRHRGKSISARSRSRSPKPRPRAKSNPSVKKSEISN